MYLYVKSLLSWEDEETAEAAKQVFAALNMYGQYFSNLKIAEQSLRYIRIIEALKKPELEAALTKIQLTSKVETLDTIQRAYEDVYMGRRNSRLGFVSASAMRRELNNAIVQHVEELNWMATQTDSEELITLCETVDARIREVNVNVIHTKTTEETTTDVASAPVE
jgi:hypothetical protein